MLLVLLFFFFNDTATTEIYTLSLHDALPIFMAKNSGLEKNITDLKGQIERLQGENARMVKQIDDAMSARSEEHTSELQSRQYLVCRLLLEKKKKVEVYTSGEITDKNRYTNTE